MRPKYGSARAELSFSINGLTSREDVLFRSYMRVVAQETVHNWLYKPCAHDRSGNFKVDLQVVTEDKLPRELLTESTSPQTMVISHIERRKLGFMCLPIDPKKLENELNRQGILLTSARTRTIASGCVSTTKAGYSHESVRLLRWPPPRLLGSAQRIQLATLMAGQAVTLVALQNRSQQPVQACEDFILELQKAGLLYRWIASHPKPTASVIKKLPPPINLLARIRNRLGLQADNIN